MRITHTTAWLRRQPSPWSGCLSLPPSCQRCLCLPTWAYRSAFTHHHDAWASVPTHQCVLISENASMLTHFADSNILFCDPVAVAARINSAIHSFRHSFETHANQAQETQLSTCTSSQLSATSSSPVHESICGCLQIWVTDASWPRSGRSGKGRWYVSYTCIWVSQSYCVTCSYTWHCPCISMSIALFSTALQLLQMASHVITSISAAYCKDAYPSAMCCWWYSVLKCRFWSGSRLSKFVISARYAPTIANKESVCGRGKTSLHVLLLAQQRHLQLDLMSENSHLTRPCFGYLACALQLLAMQVAQIRHSMDIGVSS